MPDLARAQWRKSTRSNGSGDCVEVADNLPQVIAIRDSKQPTGPALIVSPTAWQTFTVAVRADSV